MRIGFVFASQGFAAVLYRSELLDAAKRSPWFAGIDDAMAYGLAWADALGIAADVVRVDRRLLPPGVQ